jgi:hypothetical protein
VKRPLHDVKRPGEMYQSFTANVDTEDVFARKAPVDRTRRKLTRRTP